MSSLGLLEAKKEEKVKKSFSFDQVKNQFALFGGLQNKFKHFLNSNVLFGDCSLMY